MAAAPAPRFEPHNRVAGRFRLRRRLAAGGMGEVWVARNESTGADVALKVLRRGDVDSESELQVEERFRHEARLSAMLTHRSIVRVFDLLEEPDGTLVLVMELLRGESLRDYLERKGPRPAREAVAIVSPILSALAHAHDRGIVHRDVTPSNIFLAIDPDGHVTPKLVDFGIAKLAGGGAASASATAAVAQLPPVQTIDGRVLGTPRYMAPERIRGSSEIDGRADIFAAAVVLYEALTGVSPFAASSPSASLAAVLERHIDPDPRIEPRLWVEIQRALSKRPYERHGAASELATALRAAVGETEGTLEASLKRTQPPPTWDEDGADGGAEVPPRDSRASAPAGAVVLPSRRGSLTWLVAGAIVGGLLGLVVFGLRGYEAGRGAPAGGAAQTSSAERSGARATAPSAASDRAAGATATGVTAGAATGPTTAMGTPASTSTPTSNPAPVAPPVVSVTSLPRAPRPPARAHPIATTPGF